MADPLTYFNEYKNKKLNEVILLGSHDAGITKGNSNTKTQTGSIFEQANRGARFFDIRIAAFYDSGLSGPVSMTTYHDETKQKVPNFVAKNTGMTVHTTVFGKQGEGLDDILASARMFVEHQKTRNEFLILKFDKSTNWPQIKDACFRKLGDSIYKPPSHERANINECTLEQLKGRVIVLFTEAGYRDCGLANAYALGILKWRRLNEKEEATALGYDAEFEGLQYYGKGGVSRGASSTQGKIDSNALEQKHLMQGMARFKKTDANGKKITGRQAGVDGRAIGLMYWTTTGLSFNGGIKARNDRMWNTENENLLKNTVTHIRDNGNNIENFAGVKQFMPNIIMVDFVDFHKGQVVKNLNAMNAQQVNAAVNQEQGTMNVNALI